MPFSMSPWDDLCPAFMRLILATQPRSSVSSCFHAACKYVGSFLRHIPFISEPLPTPMPCLFYFILLYLFLSQASGPLSALFFDSAHRYPAAFKGYIVLLMLLALSVVANSLRLPYVLNLCISSIPILFRTIFLSYFCMFSLNISFLLVGCSVLFLIVRFFVVFVVPLGGHLLNQSGQTADLSNYDVLDEFCAFRKLVCCILIFGKRKKSPEEFRSW